MTSSGQIVGYRRVSTSTQSLARQELPDVTGRIFEEKLTGAKRDRPALQEMLNYVRDGDEVHVHSIDRLARNLKDLEDIVSEIIGKGASIRFIKEGLHFKPDQETDPFQKLMFQMLGSFAEFERAIIKTRQAEGIKKAKEEGKFEGRKAVINPYIIHDLHNRGVRPDDIADIMGIGRASVFRIRKEQEADANIFEDTSISRIGFLVECFETGFTEDELLNVDPENYDQDNDPKAPLAWEIRGILDTPEDKIFIQRILQAHPTAEKLRLYLDFLEISRKQSNELYHMKGPIEFTEERLDWLLDNSHSIDTMVERTGLPESAIQSILKDRKARINKYMGEE